MPTGPTGDWVSALNVDTRTLALTRDAMNALYQTNRLFDGRDLYGGFSSKMSVDELLGPKWYDDIVAACHRYEYDRSNVFVHPLSNDYGVEVGIECPFRNILEIVWGKGIYAFKIAIDRYNSGNPAASEYCMGTAKRHFTSLLLNGLDRFKNARRWKPCRRIELRYGHTMSCFMGRYALRLSSRSWQQRLVALEGKLRGAGLNLPTGWSSKVYALTLQKREPEKRKPWQESSVPITESFRNLSSRSQEPPTAQETRNILMPPMPDAEASGSTGEADRRPCLFWETINSGYADRIRRERLAGPPRTDRWFIGQPRLE